MPLTKSGKHYSIRAERFCKACGHATQQCTVTLKYRASAEPTVPASYLKEYTWLCEQCENLEIETKRVDEPTDKAMIFNRLLRIQEDYDLVNMTVSSPQRDLWQDLSDETMCTTPYHHHDGI